MGMVYDTALAIKERIYGNRIVLFAPLYLVGALGWRTRVDWGAGRAGTERLEGFQKGRG
jgi:hypothetical protein